MFTRAHDPFEHEFIERRLGAILVPRPARLNVDPLDHRDCPGWPQWYIYA